MTLKSPDDVLSTCPQAHPNTRGPSACGVILEHPSFLMLSLFRSLPPPPFLCPSAFLLLLSICFSFFITTLAKNGRAKALIAKTRMDGPSEPASKHWVEECKSAGRWTPPTRDRDPQANPVLYLKKKKASLWRPNMSPKVPHSFYITGFSTS